MPKPITISLSPNTFAKDVALAWKVLLTPTTWRNTDIRARVAEKLARYFPSYFIVLTSSGRQALYDALRVFGIGSGDEVIIQAFTCIAVPQPITWVGATPIYADIKEGTYSFDVEDVKKKITSKTKAIIVQHTFGIPGPIKEILELAKEHNIVVIEDCAHAIGAKLDHKPLGTFADAAVTSFGRDKMISSVFGGAIAFKNQALAAKAKEYQVSRPLPPWWWVAQQLLHPILFNGITATYFSGIGKLALIVSQKLNLLSKAVAPEEREGKRPNHIAWQYSPALAQLLQEQLEQFATRLTRRESIAQEYHNALQGSGIGVPDVPTNAQPSWLRFPLQIVGPDELHRAAKQHHMLLGDWYDAPLVPAKSSFDAFSYTMGMCPVAENTAKNVINLPTYPRLTQEQIRAVIDITKAHAT